MTARLTADQRQFLEAVSRFPNGMPERQIRSADQRVVRSCCVRREPFAALFVTLNGFVCHLMPAGIEALTAYQHPDCFRRDSHKPVAPSLERRFRRRKLQAIA